MTTASFLTQMDNHNLASDADKSMLESLGDTATSVGRFVGLSLAAGVNEISNIPASVGNLFGGEYQIDTMEDRLSSYDSDLQKYYEDHKSGIDTTGFVLGSLVPGLGGIGVLNKGSAMARAALGTSRFGAGTAEALALQVPMRERALSAAIKELSGPGSVFSMTSANTLKTLAAGFGEQALQSFAYETAVAATMQSSPILDQMNASDLVHNVMLGTALGGVLGGALTGATSVYSLKKAVTGIQRDLHPWSMSHEPAANMTAAEKALSWRYAIEAMPDPATAPAELLERATSLHSQTSDSMWLKVRESLQEFSGKDSAVAQSLFEQAKLSSADDFMNVFMKGIGASKITGNSHLDSLMRRLEEKATKAGPSLAGMTDEEVRMYMNYETTYVRVHGEGAESGIAVLGDRPPVLSITDKFSDLAAKADGIYSGNKKIFGHENNPHIPFNIEQLSHYQVESRYLWAERLDAWKPDAVMRVHGNDIPLLEKALRDSEAVKVIPVGGKIDEAITISGKDNIKAFVIKAKHDLAEKLAVVQKQQDPQVLIDKLQAYFGVPITLSKSTTFFGRWSSGKTDVGAYGTGIEISEAALQRRNLMQTVRTLEHERGHNQFQAMLRGLTNDYKDAAIINRPGIGTDVVDRNFAAVLDELSPELRTISKRVRPATWEAAKNNPNTKEYVTQAHELMADAFSYFALHPEKLARFPAFDAYAGHLINPIPQEIKDAFTVRATKLTQEEIAKITNMRSSRLTGAAVDTVNSNDAFARDLDRALYAKKLEAAGTRSNESIAMQDPLMLPKHIKIISDTTDVKNFSGDIVDGMARLEQKKVLYKESAYRVAADNLPGLSGDTVSAIDLPAVSAKQLIAAASEGPGIATSANANYGAAGMVFGRIGQIVHSLINSAKQATGDRLTPLLQRMGNDLEGAIEWSVLNEKVRASPYRYVLAEDGSKLVAKMKPAEFAERQAAGDELLELAINNANTREVALAHAELNGKRQTGLAKIDAGQGNGSRRAADEFYPIPRNPNDTPFFAYVKDDTVFGTGHSQMLYAKDSHTLELLKQEALRQRPDLVILNKEESAAYFKAHGQYDFERTMNDKLIDVSKVRGGTSASFLPKTDPAAIVKETLEWHHARDAAFVRSNVSHVYQPEFEALQNASAGATSAAKSKFGYISAMSRAETAVSDPHTDLIRMALDVSKKDAMPLWGTANRFADELVSKVWQGAAGMFKSARSEHDLPMIQAALDKAGYKGILVDSDALYNAMNGVVPRGTLSTFVNKANALISTFALRLDPLNALNNLVGSQVLLNTEINSLIKAISKGNTEIAGELAQLAKIKVPGSDASMLSPTKMIAKALGDFHSDKAGRDFFKKHGFTSTISEQYDQSLDMMALSLKTGKVQEAFDKMKAWGDLGERATGNRMAEEMNRYVAAHVMKQVTDLAQKAGIIEEREALSYINTFVNRTQGNYLASQRPLMFQGPIGQAVGLFQTYQFNLIQQLLRHVGEGEGSSAVRMMALQGSIYGVQGLPAFNAINTHIIGMAAGNTNHEDVYSTVFKTAGKDAGEWLMFGGLSNIPGLINPNLKNNMYTRGDVNPRNLFVIPTSPTDVPIYQATVKVLGNILGTANQVMQGGAVGETLIRGLEHNGISRPLAGMAQVLEGAVTGTVKSTSKTDGLLMAHDFANLASLTRLAGGKPLDEAMVQDQIFRNNTYKSSDRARREHLGSTIKLNVLAGKEISDDQMQGFMESYQKAGGKQTEFNQFMTSMYRNATVSQADQLKMKLGNPYAKHLQVMMNDGYASGSELGNPNY